MEESISKLKKSAKFKIGGTTEEEETSRRAPPFELTREGVVAAFEFFDTSGTGILTTSTLKERLSAFFPNLTSNEYRFLLESHGPSGGTNMGQKVSQLENNSPFDVNALWELIDTYQQQFYKPAKGVTTNNAVPNTPKAAAHHIGVASTFEAVSRFDPIKETFNVYDPRGTGAVDVEMLRNIMSRIGFGDLSDEELADLVQSADFDKDGKINIDDFRNLVTAKGRFLKEETDKNQLSP